MAATTGLTLLVLLLYCGQGAELPPISMSSGTATTTNKTKVQEDMPGVFDEILVQEMLEPNRSSFFEAQKPLPTLPTITTSTTLTTTPTKRKNAGIHESNQLSVPEGFHKLAELSPISLETEDKILNEPSLDASYRTSGPEDYRDSQTSGTTDSLHSNGKKHPKTDQQLKQSVLDMIPQNIGKSSDQGIASRATGIPQEAQGGGGSPRISQGNLSPHRKLSPVSGREGEAQRRLGEGSGAVRSEGAPERDTQTA
ncbi:sperm acrosome-associated protein 7 [Capricornis sumatraensis]|uniref:sperm acrosome-associated protein 7 n=1 Tax=Capricornis sumatraensis TaxID=34865 RepID=UPI00360493C1